MSGSVVEYMKEEYRPLSKEKAIEEIREAIVSNYLGDLKEKYKEFSRPNVTFCLMTASGIVQLEFENQEFIGIKNAGCEERIIPFDIVKYP